MPSTTIFTLNSKEMSTYMQIIVSTAAAVILSPIHISYGMIISKGSSWMCWLEMIYLVSQWAFWGEPERVKTNYTGREKVKKFLTFFNFLTF